MMTRRTLNDIATLAFLLFLFNLFVAFLFMAIGLVVMLSRGLL